MRRLIVFVVFACLVSCHSSVPKDVLPPKKMQSVLWDMMQADEMADYYSMKDSTFRSMAKHVDYYRKVFASHKINKADFQRSINYYQDHPARLKKILDSLQKFGERLQEADTLKPYHPPGQDTSKRKSPIKIQHP